MSGLLDQALRYESRGWSILPVKGKKPALRSWKDHQSKRASPAQLQQWFRGNGLTGVAVVCGPVSGNLVVRDFDTVDAYGRWVKEHVELAGTLPTVQTARGFHVYTTGTHDGIVEVGRNGVHEGELRGAGIVLLPPSKHPSGSSYRWTVPLPGGPVPTIEPVEAGLLPSDFENSLSHECYRENREDRDYGREQRITETTEVMGGGCGVEKLLDERLRAIVRATQPQAPRQRNKAIFDLARTLKGEPGLYDADPRDLRHIVELWHKMALPVIGTKPFEETWIDFLKGWPNVKYPKGSGPMDVIFKRAEAVGLPAAAMQFEQPKLQRLVSLCRELQRYTGDRPFYLACRTAGCLLGVTHVTAARWLFLLNSEGILRETEKGGQGENRFRATRYRYIVDDDDDGETPSGKDT